MAIGQAETKLQHLFISESFQKSYESSEKATSIKTL